MLRLLLITSFAMSALALAFLLRPTDYPLDFAKFHATIKTERSPTIIAHAGGFTPQGRYSNSLDGLEASYRSGIRWFEVDLALTTDGQAVVLHDWPSSWAYWFGGSKPVSLAEFKAAKMRGGLRQMDIADLCAWLNRRSDATVFLHIREPGVIAKANLCPDRAIAFLRFVEWTGVAKQAGFKRTAVNAASAKLDVAGIKKIAGQTDYIIMWNRSYSLDEIAEVAKSAKVVVPTVNDPNEAAALKKAGAFAIMSDVLRPALGN